MKSSERPLVVVLSGPNGADKSTIAPVLLRDALTINEFVNADTIAAGLSAFDPREASFAAGRLMLARLHELAGRRASCAFETTLASRHFAPWLRGLQQDGYRVELVFLWLPNPEEALARVKLRVASGGHGVPEATVRRRYSRGLVNFFGLYRPLADRWSIHDNSDLAAGVRPVATGSRELDETILDATHWKAVLESRRATGAA